MRAAKGKVIVLSAENCACPGGKRQMGLGSAAGVAGVNPDCCVEGEKLWRDVKAFVRSSIESQKIAPPPVGIASKVYLFPASLDIFTPDLVLFLVNSEQVSRLVTLAQFWDGKSPSFEMRSSLCWVQSLSDGFGNFNITAGDISARRMFQWDENLLVASIPGRRYRYCRCDRQEHCRNG